MAERTEEQKIFHEPIIVIFGGKKFEVDPLVIKESRAWRQKVLEVLTELPKLTKASSDKPEEFNAAIESLLITMPDIVVDLFFSYAKNLPREEIEEIATDSEMATAWQQITELAFPLLQGLVRTMRKMTPPEIKPQ